MEIDLVIFIFLFPQIPLNRKSLIKPDWLVYSSIWTTRQGKKICIMKSDTFALSSEWIYIHWNPKHSVLNICTFTFDLLFIINVSPQLLRRLRRIMEDISPVMRFISCQHYGGLFSDIVSVQLDHSNANLTHSGLDNFHACNCYIKENNTFLQAGTICGTFV